ncbi:MAG: serine/threonine-protein kinase [Nannocystaceae bacterium]
MEPALALDPLVGSILEDRFLLERPIGAGGMGRIYEAIEGRLQRRCAIKVLHDELSVDRHAVTRFLGEAQAMARIRHENVVEIYHLGEDRSGTVFFAMELLEGETLQARLRDQTRRPLTWVEIGLWLAAVASAVAAVHAAGMIHRDLKPSNIFLVDRRDGGATPKLLDFGIVKRADDERLTQVGTVVGTPYYMSPEQVLAAPLDPRSDVYSLGVVLFEALAGRLPFVGEPLQVAMQHCNSPAPRLSELRPELDVPEVLEALVAEMLVKEPTQRIQTMEEVAARLTAMVGSAGALTTTHMTVHTGFAAIAPLPTPREPIAVTVRAPALAAPEAPLWRRRYSRWALVGIVGLGLVITGVALAGGEEVAGAGPAGAPALVAAATEPAAIEPAETEAPADPLEIAEADAAASRSTDDDDLEVILDDDDDDDDADEVVETEGAAEASRAAASRRRQAPGTARDFAGGARRCRAKHHAVGGPKIRVSYTVGSDGVVSDAKADASLLGGCLAEVVKRVRYARSSRGLTFHKVEL